MRRRPDCPSSYTCTPTRVGGPGRCTPPASTGKDGGRDGSPPFVDASSDARAFPELLAIGAGQLHTCAVLSDGRVKCFGANASGQLGLGDTTPRGDNQGEMGDNLPFVNLGTGVRATSVAGGGFHTCAIVNQGSGLKCWGANDKGQLGIGDANHRGDTPGEMGDNLPFVNVGTGRTVKAVALGLERTCALLDNNQVKCWGSAESGALGLEDGLARGTNANDMGDNLPFVKLGLGRTVKALAGGALHNCAILDNDRLKCWGWGDNGSLGYGTTTSRGANVGDMGDNLPYVDLGTTSTLTWIATGAAHNCARTTDSRFLCWGYNAEGGLGLGDQANRGDGAEEMGLFLPTVQLGTGRSVRSATLGLAHSCTLLDNSLVKCFGGNARGQLNLGEVHSHGSAPNQMGDNLTYALLPSGRTAVMLAAGWEHTCAYLDDRQLRCWGRNDVGQLGVGDTHYVGVQPGESGDLSPPTILVGSP